MCCARSTDADPAIASTWTLCWQAAVGRDFLVDPSLHRRIRHRLIGAHERVGRVLIDYLVLPREIHTVTQVPAGDSVSNVARAFGNVLSRWVREVQPVRSPVLAGPYRAQPLSSIDGLREEARMLGWRPVFLGLCSTPTHCPHGALRTVLGLTPAKGFDARPPLQHFGSTVPEARASLRRWMRRAPSAEEWRRGNWRGVSRWRRAEPMTWMARWHCSPDGWQQKSRPRSCSTCTGDRAPWTRAGGRWWLAWPWRIACARRHRWRVTSAGRSQRSANRWPPAARGPPIALRCSCGCSVTLAR